MPTARTLLLLLAPVVLATWRGGCADTAPEAPLTNLLHGPAHVLVSVKLPFGERYRPGCAFPLRVVIENHGANRQVDVRITEGDSDAGAVVVAMTNHALAGGKSKSDLLCVRPPDIQADLNVLVSDPAAADTPIFKGSLRAALKPLPDETRVVLCCGEHSSDGLPLQFNHIVPVTAQGFPDQDWMFESVDLVILSDASFKDASEPAREALRNWLLGGGRLLMTSTRNGALQAAIAANLLPIKAGVDVKTIPANFNWWQTNAGLSDEDILQRKSNHQPVYVQARMGFGRVVFLFPGTEDIDAQNYGSGLFTHPALDRARQNLPDQRVQPRACETAVHRVMAPARMSRAGIFFGIGALIFCCVLAGCYFVRSRLEALGWVLVMPALLAVVLGSAFPEPRCVVSRVAWTGVSEDGRANVRREWALLEAFRHDERVTVSGPLNGSLTPVYPDKDHLYDAEYSAPIPDDRLQLDGVSISPGAPALFEGARVEDRSNTLTAAVTLRSHDEGISLNCRPPPEWRTARMALWIDPLGRKKFIENLSASEGFELSKCTDERAAIRATLGSAGGDEVVNARAALLNNTARFAADTAAGRDTLIFWSNGPQAIDTPLVEFPAENGQRPPEEGARFAVWSVAAAREKPH